MAAMMVGLALLGQITVTEVEQVAAEAGVPVVALQGALATVREAYGHPSLSARQYLIGTGELEPLYTPQPPIMGAVARADCLIAKESGGLDIPNRSGSGAVGPGQYMPSSWARHTALYRQATGYAAPLSLHALQDVRRVMAWMLATYPSSRREWTVSGC